MGHPRAIVQRAWQPVGPLRSLPSRAPVRAGALAGRGVRLRHYRVGGYAPAERLDRVSARMRRVGHRRRRRPRPVPLEHAAPCRDGTGRHDMRRTCHRLVEVGACRAAGHFSPTRTLAARRGDRAARGTRQGAFPADPARARRRIRVIRAGQGQPASGQGCDRRDAGRTGAIAGAAHAASFTDVARRLRFRAHRMVQRHCGDGSGAHACRGAAQIGPRHDAARHAIGPGAACPVDVGRITRQHRGGAGERRSRRNCSLGRGRNARCRTDAPSLDQRTPCQCVGGCGVLGFRAGAGACPVDCSAGACSDCCGTRRCIGGGWLYAVDWFRSADGSIVRRCAPGARRAGTRS